MNDHTASLEITVNV